MAGKTLRAKFKVQRVQDNGGAGETVTLSAVYSDDPASENYSWSQATPSGQLTMSISNPAARGVLEDGKSYYIDISPADATEPADAGEGEADDVPLT